MNRLIRVVAVVAGLALIAWFNKDKLLGDDETKAESTPPSDEPVSSDRAANDSGFKVLQGAKLAAHRHNDGDSFHVSHGGNDYEFRLYYVDAPETKFKSYRGGEDNGKRLDHQRAYFGAPAGAGGTVSRDQVTEVGREAKSFTMELLGRGSFTVHTNFEKVYNSNRFYAFIKPSGGGDWLRGQLVDRGLARIYTKGVATPDGLSFRREKAALRERESIARKKRQGGWRY